MIKITQDVLQSYVDCRYKAFLKLRGHNAAMAHNGISLLQELSTAACESRSAFPPSENRADKVELTSKFLQEGIDSATNCLYETSEISLHFDGVQRVSGGSNLGNFHYLPVLRHHRGPVHERQRLLLDVYGFVLAQLQGKRPEKGIILRARGKTSMSPLSRDLKQGKHIFNALAEMQRGALHPSLILNTHCQICEFRNRCHAQALEEDNISLLRGISETEVTRLNKKGIFTLNQLSYTFKPRRIKKRAKNPAHPHYFALQARALREQKVFIHGSPKLDLKDTRIYLDIEGIPSERSYYLIGLIINCNGVVYQHSFWADGKDNEVLIFIELLDYLKQYEDYSVLHYGAYEIRALRNMQQRLPAEYASQINYLLERATNLLTLISPYIYFPVYSNSLKEIAGYLGYKWSVAGASGAQSVLWRCGWDENHDEFLKAQLIQYNMEDCLALKLVSDFVEQILQHQMTPPHSSADYLHTDNFEKVEKQRGKFQKQEFALEEFDFINRCSYFDYQRDRMSARSKRPSNRTTLKQRRSPRAYRNNKIVEVLASRCPVCHGRKLSVLRSLKRQIIDLKFSGAAVRRWAVLYLSKEYRCSKCSRRFIPDGFPTIRSKFGKGLISWCMYQMVVGGQNMSRIRVGLEALFGLHIDIATIYGFKETISFHYTNSYDEILKTLLSGPVLYADETVVNLRSESGYVWCFTDGHSAYYFYKDSREGSFLPEMLKDFRGVLVSDFFAAYDSVPCRQQRCLVHLMRDFNEEIRNHPFDDELKLLAAEFSAVVKSIVQTIDSYGFKKRHLRKHIKMADKFCRRTSDKEVGSLSAERLRSRIAKYQDRLFTFLEYDEVSWNNTNAEHFIKPFARHRRTANGIFTAHSIQDYLVVLSIAETCNGQGRNFLEFLLSDNKNRFNFKSGRHAVMNRRKLAGASGVSSDLG